MSEALKSRKITHTEARKAWERLHDALYCGGPRPSLCIPRCDTDVDMVLDAYFEQQEKLEAASSRFAPYTALREAAKKALIPLAALIVSGECTQAITALAPEVKAAVIEAHEALLSVLAESPSESAPTPEADDERAKFATAMLGSLKLCGIEFHEELVEEGGPWEVYAEPEPRYFETLTDAVRFYAELAKLPAPEGMGRDELQNILQSWEIFHANLPDGEYKGLGEMRIAITAAKNGMHSDGKSVDLLRIQNPFEKSRNRKSSGAPNLREWDGTDDLRFQVGEAIGRAGRRF